MADFKSELVADLHRNPQQLDEPDALCLIAADDEAYLARLVANQRIARYLDQHHKEIMSEFIQIAERQATAA